MKSFLQKSDLIKRAHSDELKLSAQTLTEIILDIIYSPLKLRGEVVVKSVLWLE